jgi:hypothetical protein
MEIILEQLYDEGSKYVEASDRTVRTVGELMLEAHEIIEELAEEKQILQAKLNVLTRSPVNDKEGVVRELTRQNEILQEAKELSEILGLGKKKDREPEAPQKTKVQLQMLVNRYLQASTAMEKLNAIAGMCLIAANPDMASRAVKLSRAGTGSTVTGVDTDEE